MPRTDENSTKALEKVLSFATTLEQLLLVCKKAKEGSGIRRAAILKLEDIFRV